MTTRVNLESIWAFKRIRAILRINPLSFLMIKKAAQTRGDEKFVLLSPYSEKPQLILEKEEKKVR
jgi:hypothetical protein